MKHKYPKSGNLVMRYLNVNIVLSKNRTMFGKMTVKNNVIFNRIFLEILGCLDIEFV
jgi:hypothetical protein